MNASDSPNTIPLERVARQLNGVDLFRADTYGLLGALLAGPPGRELVDWLAALEPDAEGESPLAQAWERLRAAARGADPDALGEEYQVLFIGLGSGELMPYGSWYQTGYLMEHPLAALRADLAALGIEAAAETREPEDHIAALCQVMAMLVNPQQGFAAERQRPFFQAHLERWAGRFFDDLQASPSADFYRAVGCLGGIFMELEARRLEA